jgi:AcrR family transcriptional regulator
MSPRISAEHRVQYLHERREQILDAAIGVFGIQGYAGTNVADITDAAGVGKGTLYLYFDGKEDIFSCILSERSIIPCLESLTRDPGLPVRQVLTNVAEEYIRQILGILPIFRLALTEIYRFPEHSRLVYAETIQHMVHILANYLETQIQAGAIRKLDNPQLTARAFMGMLATYIITQELLGGKHLQEISTREWVDEVVRLFLEGAGIET